MERYHSGREENMGYSIRGDWRMNDRKGLFCWMHKRHARAIWNLFLFLLVLCRGMLMRWMLMACSQFYQNSLNWFCYIWPFNPKALNEKTKPTNIYTTMNSNHGEGDDHYTSKDEASQSTGRGIIYSCKTILNSKNSYKINQWLLLGGPITLILCENASQF